MKFLVCVALLGLVAVCAATPLRKSRQWPSYGGYGGYGGMYQNSMYPSYSGSYPNYNTGYYNNNNDYYNNYYNQMAGTGCTGDDCGAQESVETQPQPEPEKAPEPVAQPQSAVKLPVTDNSEFMPEYDVDFYTDLEEQKKKEELDWLWIELLASKIKDNMKKQQQENIMSGKRSVEVCPADANILHPVQLAHPTDCHKFFVCSQGKPVEIECPNQLAYDTVTERCVTSVTCN